MLFQGQAGALPAAKQTGGNLTALQGLSGELLVSEVNPVYYTLLKSNRVFFQVTNAANPSAFVGGAGGTPLLGIYNPTSSGVDLVILATRVVIRTTGTAAVTNDISWYGGVSVLPTGTNTNPINAYSQQATGSSAKSFVNTAMTGSTAITLTAPVLSVGLSAATAVINVTQAQDISQGLIVAAPGVLQAIGAAIAPTAAVMSVAVYWAEIPV